MRIAESCLRLVRRINTHFGQTLRAEWESLTLHVDVVESGFIVEHLPAGQTRKADLDKKIIAVVRRRGVRPVIT